MQRALQRALEEVHGMVLDGAWQIGLGLDQQSIAGPVQLSAIQISKELQTHNHNLALFR